MMTTSPMTKRQADALAVLVATLRTDWDPRGIMAALRLCRDRAEAHVVAIAAITAAAIPTNRTPAVIALAGPHWVAANVESPQPPGRNDRCPTHYGWAGNCPGCRADKLAVADEWPDA